MAINLMQAIKGAFQEKGLGGKIDDSITFPSGIDLMDYHMAGRNPSTKEVQPGVPFGKIFTIIGKSGTGKSSLGIQTAWNIVKKFENGGVFHEDFERSTKTSRIQNILGMESFGTGKLDPRYEHCNDGSLCTESFYQKVRMVSEYKQANRADLEVDYDTPEGPKKKILPPTVFLVDSIATMIPKKVDEEAELSGQMTASSVAKQNNAVFKRILSDLIEANIIVVCV